MRISKNNKITHSLVLEALENDEVIVLPTDTIYGFSGKISTTKEKILKIKGRREEKPFIVLIEKPEDYLLFSNFPIPKALLDLWPASLTIIFPMKDSCETIALRCPGDPWLRNIIKDIGSPLFSTSCNRSGIPALTSIDAIEKEFSKEVRLFIESDLNMSNLASTILALDGEKPRILRQGSLIIPIDLL